MRVCKVCGGEIAPETIICPHCGCAVPKELGPDKASAGLCVLSVLLPIVGLCLYCAYCRKQPSRARTYAACALGGCILFGLGTYVFAKIMGG
ncbi:MAG: hypothetical protein HFF17_07680 [Oscillospiraceae bacterium]|nr:hypothetical protein [Oscillospiraceae bacterium]